jgi:hypothetical protein
VASTLRWFAADRKTYVWALIDLVTYARTSTHDFSFGPLDLAALENQGLAVTGSDLSGVAELLSKVPGLVQEQS